MIAANLAAYFDLVGHRVLLIDYDYQGSLTDIVPYADPEKMTFSAHEILRGERSSSEITAPHPLGKSFKKRPSILRSGPQPYRQQPRLPMADWRTQRRHPLQYAILSGQPGRARQLRHHHHRHTAAHLRGHRQCPVCGNACPGSNDSRHRIEPRCSSLRQNVPGFRAKLGLSFKMLGIVPSRSTTDTGTTTERVWRCHIFPMKCNHILEGPLTPRQGAWSR